MALMEVAEQAASLDSDGIDVHFINDSAVGEGLRVSRGDRFGLYIRPLGLLIEINLFQSGREVDALFARVKPGAQTP